MEPLAAVDDLPPDPLEQDRRMNAVLVPMQCLMYGNAMKWDSSTSSGKPTGGERPPGESMPLHTIWQQAYVLAAPEAREQVIADATDALITYRCGPRVEVKGEPLEEWEQRVIDVGEGWTSREVAVHFNTGTSNIVRVRRKFNRDPNNGTRLPDEPSIAELTARGLTPKQIGWVLGWSRQRVEYHVNKQKRLAA